MKQIKVITVYFFSFLITSNLSLFSQGFIDYELKLTNRSHRTDLYCKVTPIGCIFNGNENEYSRYKLEPIQLLSPMLYGDIRGKLTTSYPNNSVWINQDATGSDFNFDYKMAIGYGKYLIEFGTIEAETNEWVFERISDNAYCYIDYTDANYPYGGGFINDVEIFLDYDYEFQRYQLGFAFDGGNYRPITHSLIENRTIKLWHQVGKTINGVQDPSYLGSPNKGSFYTDDELQANRYFPIRAPIKLPYDPYEIRFQHILPEICNLNLNITAGYEYYIKRDSLFIMNNAAYLKLKSNVNTKLNVLQNSKLQLNSYSVCTIEPFYRFSMARSILKRVQIEVKK